MSNTLVIRTIAGTQTSSLLPMSLAIAQILQDRYPEGFKAREGALEKFKVLTSLANFETFTSVSGKVKWKIARDRKTKGACWALRLGRI